MEDEIYSLLEGLYYTEDSARAVLVKIGFPPSAIPAFKAAATFWPEVVLKLQIGVMLDGRRRLLEAAQAQFPHRADIGRLLAQMSLESPGAAKTANGKPVSVLCWLSDPTRKLRLDQEGRLLQRLADRGVLRLSIQNAARTDDIIRSIRDEKPQIIHFGGHGSQDGRLMFEGEAGAPAYVYLEAVAGAIAAVADSLLECVVLNSCYSARSAAAFRGVTKAVAGSVTAVPDECALAFAEEFYAEVAVGNVIRRAFEAGRAAAGVRNCETWGFYYEPFNAPSA